MKHGIIATTIKGVFKIYVIPAMGARAALATLTGGWSDLVAEARREYEARRGAGTHATSEGSAAGMASPAPKRPAAEPNEQQGTEPARPTTPGSTGQARGVGTRDGPPAAPPRDETTLPPSTSARAQPESLEAPSSPTLVETGDSGVELRPSPAISPAHATSGVIAHVPPEVRHKLAGDGPIRA